MRGEIIKYNRAMPVDVLQLSVTDKLPQSGLTASQPPQGGGLSGSILTPKGSLPEGAGTRSVTEGVYAEQ